MPKLIRVIVEKDCVERWTAYFADIPQVAADGDCSHDALHKLIDLLDCTRLDIDAVSSVDHASRDDYLEFDIPLIGQNKTSIWSDILKSAGISKPFLY